MKKKKTKIGLAPFGWREAGRGLAGFVNHDHFHATVAFRISNTPLESYE